MSVGRFQNSGTEATFVADSGKRTTSYFGISGQEDLGGGLSAVFGLESWLAADSGAIIGSGTFARRANVGLKGSYGTVLLGNNPTALFVQALLFAPYANSQGLSPTQRFLYSRYASVEGGSVWQNSIQYQSPTINGFSGTLSAALKEASGGDNSYGASLYYSSGPLAAGLAYQNWRVGTSRQNTYLLGASYDFSALKLYGQFGRVNGIAHGDDQRYGQIGARVPAGPGAFLASFGHTKIDASTARSTVKTLTVGYDYALSKKTDIYLTGMYDKLSTAAAGTTYLVGLRHNF